LVFHSSTIAMMHGTINISTEKHLTKGDLNTIFLNPCDPVSRHKPIF